MTSLALETKLKNGKKENAIAILNRGQQNNDNSNMVANTQISYLQ